MSEEEMGYFDQGWGLPEKSDGGDGDSPEWRFRLNYGQSKEIVFVTDAPVRFYEHKIYHEGQVDHFTCGHSRKDGQCYACEQGDNRRFVGAFTIIDQEGYEKQDGTEIDFVRRPLVMLRDELERITKRRERLGSLVGHQFEVSRTEKNTSPTTGDDWIHLGEVDLDEEYPDVEPMDMKDRFEPMTYQEQKAEMASIDFDSDDDFEDDEQETEEADTVQYE
jgi:hypothetical protein